LSYSGDTASRAVQVGQRSAAPVPHTSRVVLLVGLLAASFAVGMLAMIVFLRARTPRAQAAVPVSSARVTSAVVVDVGVPVEALPVPSAAPATTRVLFPRSSISHRVWIDGVLVGDDQQSITTKCGRHTIKIGSQGKARDLDLPCGRETTLD
jgi:hypothetical protein